MILMARVTIFCAGLFFASSYSPMVYRGLTANKVSARVAPNQNWIVKLSSESSEIVEDSAASDSAEEEAPAPKNPNLVKFIEKTEEELALLTNNEREMYEKAQESARLRAAEKFIVQKTGNYECSLCSYVYVESQNDRAFDDLPRTWKCPVCRAPKTAFIAQEKIIAGFADNQRYGFGSNTLTSGQKNLLIFGGLGFFFVLFLLGYALD